MEREEEGFELTTTRIDDVVDMTFGEAKAEDVVNYLLNELSTQTFVPIPVVLVSQVFSRINVPPDGSCFYSAAWIGAFTQKQPEVDLVCIDPLIIERGAKRLRFAVARRLSLSQTRRDRLREAGYDPDSYAENVASGSWADEAEILAASKELRRPVMVFERSSSSKGTVMAWVGGNEQTGFPIIVWRKNEHYDSLVPKCQEEKLTEKCQLPSSSKPSNKTFKDENEDDMSLSSLVDLLRVDGR
jgi:hypothetical protein